MAFEDSILRTDPRWADSNFVMWGAGRDGKDFFKSLSPDLRGRVRCFVDVDEKKIAAGFHANRDLGIKIPTTILRPRRETDSIGISLCNNQPDKGTFWSGR